jgi:pimeloyl-ACP methyl ester carboxylesterase
MGGGIARREALVLGAGAAMALGGPARAMEAKSGGARVHWSSRGHGSRTLIFVHGWTGDESIWARQVPAFARRYRVITLDLPGHGKSSGPGDGVYTIPMFAQAVEAVRQAAGVERAVVIGHSMGGLVVRQYYLMYPSRVEALVLADALMRGPDAKPAPPRPFTGAEGRANLERTISGMLSSAPKPIRSHVLKVSLSTDQQAVAGAMDATQHTPWSPTPTTVPVLGLYADHSRLKSDDVIARIYPTMQYRELAGTDHFLMLERPDAFNAALQSFLDGLK